MHHDDRAFSLIELLIVVAIILIIAAIAIPNLMRSRIVANQASAIQSLRMLHTAEVTYSSTYGVGFASTLLALGPPASGSPVGVSAAALIDSILAAGVKSGYIFTYTPALPDASGKYYGYTLTADPASVGQTGTFYYYTDQTYIIRGNTSGSASASDSPIAQ